MFAFVFKRFEDRDKFRKGMGKMRVSEAKVKSIINKYGRRYDSIVAMLQDVQEEYHYLPEDAIKIVARELKLPLIQVYGVCTFFKAFSLKPRGRHTCTVCMGTACHVRGAPKVLDELERKLGIKAKETTRDMEFTLDTVNCLGACALGPIVVMDGKYYGQMTAGKVAKIFTDNKKKASGKRR